MIVLISARGHGYTVRSLVEGPFGVPTPTFRRTHYDRLFGAHRVPRATYVFADLERLAPWELRRAARLYRSMTAAGLRCLNDPARAMARVELLTALHAAGINGFRAYRADADPRPSRFPVFVRREDDHVKPSTALYADQAALDRGLRELRDAGTPLRGLLVVEHVPARHGDTFWAKWATWRIGDHMIVEHFIVERTWVVKNGDYRDLTDAMAADEYEAVVTNRYATELRPVFAVAGIEYGRADHGTVDGRTVVYEINTNPFVSRFSPHPMPERPPTIVLARTRLAEALESIDTAERGRVRIDPIDRRSFWHRWRPVFSPPKRP